MKIGLGLYRHMMTREYYDFARQAGCTDVVVHLVDYFKQGGTNPNNNQPTGAKYEPWGVAGDPEKLWTVAELTALRRDIEDAGLRLAAIENIDPAHWHDILLDGPKRAKHIENVKTACAQFGRGWDSGAGLQLQPGGSLWTGNGTTGKRECGHAGNGWAGGGSGRSEWNDLEHGV